MTYEEQMEFVAKLEAAGWEQEEGDSHIRCTWEGYRLSVDIFTTGWKTHTYSVKLNTNGKDVAVNVIKLVDADCALAALEAFMCLPFGKQNFGAFCGVK